MDTSNPIMPEHTLYPKAQMPSLQLATSSTTLHHAAARTSSTTLNHLRGPSAAVELEEMKERRAKLVGEVRRLSAEIADVELQLMLAEV